MRLDWKSVVLGGMFGAGAMLMIGEPWRARAADGPVPAAPSAAGRYDLKVWSSANSTSQEHGAYLVDTATGDVRKIDGTSSEAVRKVLE